MMENLKYGEQKIPQKDYKVELFAIILFLLSILVWFIGILLSINFSFCDFWYIWGCSVKWIIFLAALIWSWISLFWMTTFWLPFLVHIIICIEIITRSLSLLSQSNTLMIKMIIYLSIIFASIWILPYIIALFITFT